jgi:dTDP-4-amino-4,6-dideoxygalactose transaminase
LAATSIIPPETSLEGGHNFHLFGVRSNNRDNLSKFLARRNISSGIHYPVPLHLTNAYQNLGYPGHGSLPVSEKLASEILSLPMYPELSHNQLVYLLEVLLGFVSSGRESC